jgi:hypothetical protein
MITFWYILGILTLIILIARILTLKKICPKCKKRTFDNFENSKSLLLGSDLEIYEISKRCNACSYTEIWYLKRTFDIYNKTTDRYYTEKPDI